MCTQCSPTRSDFISLGDFNQLVVHDEQCRSSLLRVCEMAAGSSASAQLNNGGAAQYRHQRVLFASLFGVNVVTVAHSTRRMNVTGEFTADRRASYRD
jgi:hypothetical protein